jgi:hypothetical protein
MICWGAFFPVSVLENKAISCLFHVKQNGFDWLVVSRET